MVCSHSQPYVFARQTGAYRKQIAVGLVKTCSLICHNHKLCQTLPSVECCPLFEREGCLLLPFVSGPVCARFHAGRSRDLALAVVLSEYGSFYCQHLSHHGRPSGKNSRNAGQRISVNEFYLRFFLFCFKILNFSC